ncbi:DUF397 domain-containing protein [Plantactinospora sp. WMMC1484]|uniref:DUF397 domain-containing protein n=1 Tax=Plantactinospora sp. WMMC1484 TaxID=3404122 RepID=UPI003BF60663
MDTPDLTNAAWRKSTRSDNNGGACIEVAELPHTITAVRDSKDHTGPVLTFTTVEWTSFIDGVKASGFNA